MGLHSDLRAPQSAGAQLTPSSLLVLLFLSFLIFFARIGNGIALQREAPPPPVHVMMQQWEPYCDADAAPVHACRWAWQLSRVA